ncbi:hypothetical protein HQ619_07095 [Burkholderia gladioli]|uniref:hypothetical protein n=1 Tax=Burkholderia gladioli TaxID=28095 RepID=UPI0015601C7D|nr:hypothetical protein [Burkholderia gladioli]NRF83691.1 hypothetical protein [Burkholderia gladioli]
MKLPLRTLVSNRSNASAPQRSEAAGCERRRAFAGHFRRISPALPPRARIDGLLIEWNGVTMRQADYARQFDESTQRRAGRRQAARRVTIVIGTGEWRGTIGTDRREPERGRGHASTGMRAPPRHQVEVAVLRSISAIR